MNEMFLSHISTRTFKPGNCEKIRTAEPQSKFTGSYKKMRVIYSEG